MPKEKVESLYIYKQQRLCSIVKNIELSCITYIRLKVMFRQLCSFSFTAISFLLLRFVSSFLKETTTAETFRFFFWISFITFFCVLRIASHRVVFVLSSYPEDFKLGQDGTTSTKPQESEYVVSTLRKEFKVN